MSFSRSLAAGALWDYGEDELAARAFKMSETDLQAVQAIAAWYQDPDYPLPLIGQRVLGNHVVAFAALTFFDGHIRPLARSRRRPQKHRPAEYGPEAPRGTA
ncbi:hypothetical protein D1871_08035 [Nakamurella silvestris]|nr:hypothetical protein D1871_08035 [Nakamurella silvestris]